MLRNTTLPGCSLLVMIVLAGCTSGSKVSEIEATSLLGEPLARPVLSDEVYAKRQRDLDEAIAEHAANPKSEMAAIWHGRRLAYLGRYRDAIDVFTRALVIHPQSHRLLRHRGHRYITVRQLQDAIGDLSRAAELIEDVPDQVEPDGMPNALGIPTSTTNSNIWYHLGLAHYLTHDFASSARAYQRCYEIATNDDTRVAAGYWLVLSSLRSNDQDRARAVLSEITRDMHVIENTTYHQLLLLFKGDVTIDDISVDDAGDGVQDATKAYGIAVWHLVNGRPDEARRRFEAILDAGSWAAFGFIATEAEIAAMLAPPSESQ